MPLFQHSHKWLLEPAICELAVAVGVTVATCSIIDAYSEVALTGTTMCLITLGASYKYGAHWSWHEAQATTASKQPLVAGYIAAAQRR